MGRRVRGRIGLAASLLPQPTAPFTGEHMFETLPRRPSGRIPARQHDTPFCPSRPQQAYLEVWLDPQAPKTISGISRHINVPRRTIQHWLTRDGFVVWFNHQVERHTGALWLPALHKLTLLALEGSIAHLTLLARIRGVLHPDAPDNAGQGLTVVIGIPRPSEAPVDRDVTCSSREPARDERG